jgi:branched-chain amino acid transport system ATP-binding protein
MALLETHGLSVAFGGVHANDAVDIAVERGTICGLIGPNGAGKTTLIDAITGFTRPSAGRVEFDGTDVTLLSAAARADAGLVRTFQSIELFDDLTVWENLLVAAERPRWWTVAVDLVRPRCRSEAEDQARWSLDVMGLAHVRDTLSINLSHGQRKLVSVARALANRPRLLLLDEPAAGLDAAESTAIGSHLRDFLERGITVFLVDHDMSLVLDVCEHIYVVDFGRVIASGPPAEVRSNPDVIAAYLGGSEGGGDCATVVTEVG